MNVDTVSAIRISLLVGLSSTLLALVPAIFLAWLLSHKNFRGKTLLTLVLFFPMVSPPVVTGYLMLKLLGRNSFFGELLSAWGVSIPFSLLGAILASLVVGFPLLVMFIRATFAGLDSKLETYAQTAGHSPLSVFMKVTLPLSFPGILAGAIVFLARSLGEFGATVVLAGNMEGKTRTIPLAIYTLMDSPSGEDQTQTLLLASIGLSFMALLAYEFFGRRYWTKIEWRKS